MADALVSPPVAAVMGAISVAALIVAFRKVKDSSSNLHIAPLMGVMGAFIFAAQMLNFTIPGTGSSGHIVGGVLLASVLGPWAALITLSSVLVIQAFFFADGGLLVLGCNIFNMGVTSCVLAYYLIYRPIVRHQLSYKRIFLASVLSSVVALEAGAFMVTVETELSGITALPIGRFLLFMMPIHFAIGIIEGVATTFVIYFIYKNRPDLLYGLAPETPKEGGGKRVLTRPVLIFAAAAIVCAGVFSWYASSRPDGLEWSLQKMTGSEEITRDDMGSAHQKAEAIQKKSAFMPDYSLDKSDAGTDQAAVNPADPSEAKAEEEGGWGEVSASTSLAGLTGSFIVLGIAFAIGALLMVLKKKHRRQQPNS